MTDDGTYRAHTLPRLFLDAPLQAGEAAMLPDAPAHYLKNVLRKNVGDEVRLFNGRDGEYGAVIETLGKKNAVLRVRQQTRAQPRARAPLQLLFTPLKKDRLDFLIEKAVELGVTDLHPILTARTTTRQINPERITAQIIEASEQCERMEIPRLHPLITLPAKIAGWDKTQPLLWARERGNAIPINQARGHAFLIGPEGGFAAEEHELLTKQPFIHAISLGETVLRAETAALVCLATFNPLSNGEREG